MATLWKLENQWFDDAGAPLSSGTISAFEEGTSTPKNMFSDQSGTILGTSITLSSSGRCPSTGVWLKGAYKFLVKNSSGTLLYTFDKVREYDQIDFTGLTATIDDLNSTSTTTVLKNSLYTVTTADRGKTILCDASGAGFNINLPTAVSAGNKFIIRIKKIDIQSNSVTIDPSGAETIDGNTTFKLDSPNDSVILHSDGSTWNVIAVSIRDRTETITTSKILGISDENKLFLANSTSGQITIKLPSPSTVGKGWKVGAKKIDSSLNTVVVETAGSETIDGNSTVILIDHNSSVEVITDGIEWFIIYSVGDVSADAFPLGTFNGFLLENDSGDPAHDIKVYPGAARSSNDLFNIRSNSAFIKRIDANWVEGSGQGGFPSGLTLSSNTWYHYFVIAKPTGQVDFGYDSALTASNLLADASSYSIYERISSVLTDGSSQIVPFINKISRGGERFMQYLSPIKYPSDIPIGDTNAHLITIGSPLGVKVDVRLAAYAYRTSIGATYIIITDPDTTDNPPIGASGIGANLGCGNANSDLTGCNIIVTTDTSSQIRYRASATSTYLNVSVIGWWE